MSLFVYYLQINLFFKMKKDDLRFKSITSSKSSFLVRCAGFRNMDPRQFTTAWISTCSAFTSLNSDSTESSPSYLHCMASNPLTESEDPDVNIRLYFEPDSSLTIADPVRPDAFIIKIFKIYIIIDYS